MRQVPLLELPVDPDEGGDPMERIADPRGYALEQIWDEGWRLNLLDVVLERVKTEVSERQFRIFHCHVVKEWSVREVCRGLLRGGSCGRITCTGCGLQPELEHADFEDEQFVDGGVEGALGLFEDGKVAYGLGGGQSSGHRVGGLG